jgi:hypothetical protein
MAFILAYAFSRVTFGARSLVCPRASPAPFNTTFLLIESIVLEGAFLKWIGEKDP